MEETFYIYFSREDIQKIAAVKKGEVLKLKSNGQGIAVSVMKDDSIEIEYTTEVDRSDCEHDHEPHYNEGND